MCEEGAAALAPSRILSDEQSMPLSLRRLALALSTTLAAGAAAGPSAGAATGPLVHDPSSSRPLSATTWTACSEVAAGSACVSDALGQINAARAAEGVGPMVLPGNFASMPAPQQLLNLADLERVDRGLTPITGLSTALDRDAQNAAAQDRDPMPSEFLGTEATGNWAGGLASTLEADFEWMYDDGLGSPNLDCSPGHTSGCWGHRHDILWSFTGPIAMGAGSATGRYGRSLTELFVGGDRATGAGGRDAPAVRPALASAARARGTARAGESRRSRRAVSRRSRRRRHHSARRRKG